MNIRANRFVFSVIVVLAGILGTQRYVGAADTVFEFQLYKPAMTSAGIYDESGKLVRVLWTMKELPAGKQSDAWDGTDQFNHPSPAGAYRFAIAVNRSTYTNVGAIGNSGQPPSDKGHTPTNIESVAADKDGSVYTANGWDEAGADFKKWNADGNSVYDAQFQIRNGRPNGAPYAIAVDEEYIYCAVGGWEREPWNNRQQIQRFSIKDGKAAPFTGKSEKSSTELPKIKTAREGKGPSDVLLDGHIQLYEWPELLIPVKTRAMDAALMKAPLRSLDVAGNTIYVADALAGKIRLYDSSTGMPKGGFDAELPTAVAVDFTGQIWVACNHDTVRAYRADGYSGVTYGGLGDITSLAFGRGGTLYATDAAAGQVLTLDTGADPAKFVPYLGNKAKPGDRAADRFFSLRGVAADNDGNIFTIQREPGTSGARLAKWSGGKKLVWEQFGTEFVSLGNYGSADPEMFYTISGHRHRLIDRAKGTWEYLGNTSDPAAEGYASDPHGAVRVLRLGKNDFAFMPKGDGVQVYRVDGPVLRLATLVGGRDPGPGGGKEKGKMMKWSWSDSTGAGKPDAAKIAAAEGSYACFGMDVDGKGNIWFANTQTHSVWMLPMALDGRGNPSYDWKGAKEVAPRDQSELGFEPNMVQAAEDGSYYAFGWSKAFPQPKNNPFWMGGTTLCRFDAKGERRWAVELPQTCVGMDVIPGGKGGVMVGGGKDAVIYHYSADGLLIGKMQPGEAMNKQTGWMDNHASVAVNRDGRDGVLDVFAEDDFVCRIGWYRVGDEVEVIGGEVGRR